ncbi:exonuclease domain-containing protein [Shewanella marisflavi]|uniref:DNA polymerase III subunit epsilon n=1 Tax=Shewanella marisflavi TaxID=260364 RepID=A0AAC9XMZ3_9GAMM|nr:exonuclease domain-containing protein [Shewanella marisflavi]ASJ96442.1 DNA polymerase III subunit epsilon [Shewanella marisflavi]
MFAGLKIKSQLCWRALLAKDATLKAYQQALLDTMDKPLNEAELLAIDLEMTGLNAHFDQILSIGLVPIRQGQLVLKEAQHKLVQIEGSVGQSATIHGILDNHLDAALSPEQAMAWFLAETQGKVLVAHHAPLDLAFLQTGIQAYLGEKTQLLAIDTLLLEKRRLLRQHEHLQEGSLRLGKSRARYGLPVYAAHNALIDALACGELLLAQIAAMGGMDSVKLTELLG